MKFDPFIAPALLSQPRGAVRFNVPIQLSLIPAYQSEMTFALRLQNARQLHYDFRLRVLRTLFSLVLFDKPSLDPSQRVRAKLMGDHHPAHLESERVIRGGQPGVGPTMPVDLGKFVPIVRNYATHELEVLDQIAQGDFRFTLDGEHLKGGWQLLACEDDYWVLRKLEDEHASTTRVLDLNVSVKTGKRLKEL